MASMSKALSQGMVLVMSLWDDHYANMLWLDSTYPTDKDASTPGIGRGECETSSGVSTLQRQTNQALTLFRYPPMWNRRTLMRP